MERKKGGGTVSLSHTTCESRIFALCPPPSDPVLHALAHFFPSLRCMFTLASLLDIQSPFYSAQVTGIFGL